MKPEDANPDTTWITTRSNRLNSACDGPARDQIYFFTAKQCAEIARAYGECIVTDFMCGRNAEMYAWQEKFKEWETTK